MKPELLKEPNQNRPHQTVHCHCAIANSHVWVSHRHMLSAKLEQQRAASQNNGERALDIGGVAADCHVEIYAKLKLCLCNCDENLVTTFRSPHQYQQSH